MLVVLMVCEKCVVGNVDGCVENVCCALTLVKKAWCVFCCQVLKHMLCCSDRFWKVFCQQVLKSVLCFVLTGVKKGILCVVLTSVEACAMLF